MTPAPAILPRTRAVLALALTAAVGAACEDTSEPPTPTSFAVPIEGQQDVDWVYGPLPNHDNEPGGAEDYQCGVKTIDFRQTTDFIIPDFRSMELGVDVYAAAAGEVVEVTDGFYDRQLTYTFDRQGNAVRIRHDDGIESRYRFLKAGSIRVQPGDQVERGEVIAQVGSSGDSDWPRLGFEARNARDEAFDPWAGACSGSTSYWDDQPPYPNRFLVIDQGATDLSLTLRRVANRPPTVTSFQRGDAVGYWVHIINRPPGEIALRLVGPSGTIDSLTGTFTAPDPENTVLGGSLLLPDSTELGDWFLEYIMNDSAFARIEFTVNDDAAASASPATRASPDTTGRVDEGGAVEWLPKEMVLDG